MGKILAIKGHPTRGKEVIKILEMLGGHNKYHINDTECNLLYTIREGDDVIIGTYPNGGISQVYTLEQFLEKYPFKVGDMVQHKNSTSCRSIYKIKKLIWKDNQIHYLVYNPWQEYDKCTITAEYLQPYKEELRQERKYPELRMDLDDDDKLATEVVIGGDKILPPNGYLIGKITQVDNGMLIEFVKKQPQYPKTYNECYEIMDFPENQLIKCGTYGYKAGLLSKLQELLICRDAYWQIAGEEMGLSESWKPDWSNHQQQKYTIHFYQNQLTLTQGPNVSYILAFPTKEMRDFFAENFNELIMKCRDFLYN